MAFNEPNSAGIVPNERIKKIIIIYKWQKLKIQMKNNNTS